MTWFTADLRRETADLLERILALPFNRELAQGTLETGRFQHYVVQDALYLLEYGRVLARISVGYGPHGVCVWPQPGRYSLGHTGMLR